jgi:hypothetical protein
MTRDYQGQSAPRRRGNALGPSAVVKMELSGWDEIAGYLKVSRRTAQSYANHRGLPVRRHPGPKGRVWALPSELDQWKGKHNVAPSARVSRPRYLFVFGVLAAIAASVIATILIHGRFARPQVTPASITMRDNAVVALDSNGHTLWQHQYRRPIVDEGQPHLADLARIADIDGSGHPSVLVPVLLADGPNPTDYFVTRIDCFSADGRLRWSYQPQVSLRFGHDEFHGPWYVFALMVARDGNSTAIFAAFSHYRWGNSFVTEISPKTGRGTIRFVNTGTLRSLSRKTLAGTDYLLIGGFNNEYDGASLAIMKESQRFAASPQTPGTRHPCANCPSGSPDYFFVFPRSEINRSLGPYELPLEDIRVIGNDVEVSASEDMLAPQRLVSYYLLRFSAFPQLISRRFSSEYESLHRSLEASHRISHAFRNCPGLLNPVDIRLWTPSGHGTTLRGRSSL